MADLIKKGADMIANAQKILVFSGAGLSTESGIPDFRSPGGLWEKYDPSDFYYQKIISDERARAKYWEMIADVYEIMKGALPNHAHMAIKTLEDTGKLAVIVTQNIDGLHHLAGNSPDKIIEIHGTVATVSCLSCGKSYGKDEIIKRLKSGVKVPYCDDCSGILKPDSISFGQAMPEDKMARAFKIAGASDLCIVLGSSLVVYPAASVPSHAIQSGAGLMVINRETTPIDGQADLVIHDSVSKALGRMV
ncbi:MAG: sigma factor regulator FecR [Desulfobacterales bacterium]|nr:sigma factor regulator FecR [Desulfobacterales bacterium]